MKVLSLGSNGLLSTALGRFCERNGFLLDVLGLDEPKGYKFEHFSVCDLTRHDFQKTDFSKYDLVVYAAGAGIQANLQEKQDLIYSLNLDTPIALMYYLKEVHFKGIFVTFGSYFEIGENERDHLWTEDEILHSSCKIRNAYCISKRLLSRFVECFNADFHYWHFILPTIYAEYENPLRLIPYTLNNIMQKKECSFTSGDQIRQYIYIEDVMNILFAACKKSLPAGIYNIPGAETLSVKELVKILFHFFGKQISADMFGQEERRDTQMRNLKLDGAKLYEHLEPVPMWTVEQIIPRYCAFLSHMNGDRLKE